MPGPLTGESFSFYEQGALRKAFAKKKISETMLISFLDSIGRAGSNVLNYELAPGMTTVLDEQESIHRTLSPKVFKMLKSAIKDKHLTAKASVEIFGVNKDCCGCPDHPQSLQLVSFDKDTSDYNLFAIKIGCDANHFYFFRSNHLICSQQIYQNEIYSFKDRDGQSVVYFPSPHSDGGMRYFLKYIGNDLVPVLELPRYGSDMFVNTFMRSSLTYSLAGINPLTFAFEYSHEVCDSSFKYPQSKLISGSATIQFSWNKRRKRFEPNPQAVSITNAPLYVFFPHGLRNHNISNVFPEKKRVLFFLNIHYRQLKDALGDPMQRKGILCLLMHVRYNLWLETNPDYKDGL